MASSVQKLLLVIYFFVFLSIYLLSPTSSLAAIAGDQEIEAAKEAKALLKWKSSLDNQSQSILSSWNGSNPCNWVGIACNNDGSVTNISLGNYSLKGNIPSSMGNLSNLVNLYLGDNELSGSIPEELGMLRSLDLFDLVRNHLTGTIPSSICNITKLSFLYLFSNELSGPIPAELGMLRSVHQLQLWNNSLTGKIPDSIGNLSNMDRLHLFMNELSGPIPSGIKITHFKSFQLAENELTGNLPENICLGGLLEILSVENNHFSGPIPKTLKNYTRLISLTILLLDDNLLSSSIPLEIQMLSDKASQQTFEGRLQNSKAFSKAPFESLRNSKDLCGDSLI
ncbi:hypothetical protein POUND7_017785 [Theobroma cacao]